MKQVKTIFVVTLLALLAISPLITLASQFTVVDYYWSIPGVNATGRASPEPGEQAYLVVLLRFSSPKAVEGTVIPSEYLISTSAMPASIYDVKVELELPSGFQAPDGSTTVTEEVVEAIAPGQVFTVSFPVRVLETAKLGDHTAKLRISYDYAVLPDGRIVEVDESETLSFTFKLTGRPILEIKASPLHAGTDTLTLTVINKGHAEARSVKLWLQPSQITLLNASSPITLGDIEPGEEKTIALRASAPPTLSGIAAPVMYTAVYGGTNGETYCEQGAFAVEVKEPEEQPVLRVSIAPNTVLPGSTTAVSLVIENIGSGDARNVTLNLALQASLGVEPSTLSIAGIPSNGKAEVEVLVHASEALAGSTVPVQVTLSYYDSYGYAHVEQRVLTLTVAKEPKEKPRLEARIVGVAGLDGSREVGVGDSFTLLVMVSNKGNATAIGVKVSAKPLSGAEPQEPVETLVPGPLRPGASAVLKLGPFKATALNPVFQLNVTCTGVLVGQASSPVSLHVVEVEETKLTGRPDLRLAIEAPSQVSSGKASAEIKVVNEGSAPASDVEIYVAYGEGLSLGPFKLGSIAPGSSKEINVDLWLPQAYAGRSIPVTAKASYKGVTGKPYAAEARAWVSVEASRPGLIVTVQPTEIEAGASSTLTLALQAPYGEARDIVVTISSPELTIESGDHYTVASLKPGERAEVKVKVFAPEMLAGRTCHLVVTVQYEHKGIVSVENKQLSVLVYGVPRLDVLSETIVPPEPKQGELATVTITIVNRGSDTAKDMLAYAEAPPELKIVGSERVYIGDVMKGSPTPITFSFNISESAKPGTYPVKITVEYKDSLGRSYNKTWTIEVPVTEAPSQLERSETGVSITTYALIAAVAVIAVAAVLAYIKVRKR